MEQRKYLITGATGKTGVYTTRFLLKAGHAVRAFVHQEDERSAALRAEGAEIFVGDLLEHDDVIRAMEGVAGAYLCYPVRPGYIQATSYFADAAKRAGVEVVIEMSQISARDDSESHAARDHWIAERVLDWSGVPAVHIRPTYFSEWLIFPWVLDPLVQEGKITLPYGAGRHAPIAAEDQARLIANILTEPSDHIGKTYSLFGPVELNQQEIAEEIGKVLGRKINGLRGSCALRDGGAEGRFSQGRRASATMARMTRTPVQGTTPQGAYSPGIIAEGRFLYVSGQGPLVDGKYEPAPVGEETRLTLENIGRILASAGAGFEDVVRCGCFLADINDFDAMNGVYATYFGEPRPARTTVQVAALPGGIKVEIDCVVLLPE